MKHTITAKNPHEPGSVSARLLAGVAASLLIGWAFHAEAQQTTLTYASFGGALQKGEEAGWLTPYMKENPSVKVIYDGNIDYAKVKVMVESGNVTWDVLTTGDDFGLKADEALLEKLDCNVIPCSDMPKDKYQTTGYRVAQTTSGLALGYNTKKMPAGLVPQGWADMFDLKKFPGKRVVMMDASSYVLEQVLLADGVDQQHMYPLDFDRAIKKLNSLGSNLLIAPSYQGCGELIGSGEAVMGGCWYGRLTDVKQRGGAPVEIQWNQAIVSAGYYSIPKGSKNKDQAMKLIAWIISPEHNAALSDYIPYGPSNPKAMAHVKAEVKPNMLSSYLDKAFFPDNVWYDANRAEVNKRWTEWVSGMK